MLDCMSHAATQAQVVLPPLSRSSRFARNVGRIALGSFLVFAGTGHLTFGRESFQGQVPDWIPLGKDFVVLSSGFVEIALGSALIFLRRWQVAVGWVVAAFFVAVFPATFRNSSHTTIPSASTPTSSVGSVCPSSRSSSSGLCGPPRLGAPGVPGVAETSPMHRQLQIASW